MSSKDVKNLENEEDPLLKKENDLMINAKNKIYNFQETEKNSIQLLQIKNSKFLSK